MGLIGGPKQTLKTGVLLLLLLRFVTHDLPLRLAGSRKLLLGLYRVGVLLKIIFDDPPTCFKGEIQRLTPRAKRAFWALFDTDSQTMSTTSSEWVLSGPEWQERSRVAGTVQSGRAGPE